MNCKHEKFRVNYAKGAFECLGHGCRIFFEAEDIVIIPDKTYQLMQDVIEAAIEERMLYKEWEGMQYEGETDNKFLVFTDMKDAVWRMFKDKLIELDNAIKALDALDKGDNERGL